MRGFASARPKLAEPAGFTSPARAELALAIAAKAAADESHARLEAAHSALWETYSAAQRTASAAEDAVEQTKADAVNHTIACATGQAGEPPMSIKAARVALAEAEDALTTASAARNGLDARIAASADDQQAAVKRVKAAALAVVRESPAVATMLADVNRLQRELICKGRVFTWLMRTGVLPRPDREPPQHDDELRHAWSTKQFIDALPVGFLADAQPGNHTHNGMLYSGVPPWQAALAALETDPNAALPE